jgi:hypothetical protein
MNNCEVAANNGSNFGRIIWWEIDLSNLVMIIRLKCHFRLRLFMDPKTIQNQMQLSNIIHTCIHTCCGYYYFQHVPTMLVWCWTKHFDLISKKKTYGHILPLVWLYIYQLLISACAWFYQYLVDLDIYFRRSSRSGFLSFFINYLSIIGEKYLMFPVSKWFL